LPFTGGNTIVLFWFGVIALAGGALLIRKRRTA
jgi:LPXTG-motif cell wall-anchored protein